MATQRKFSDYRIPLSSVKRDVDTVTWNRNGAKFTADSFALNWHDSLWQLWFERGTRWHVSYLAYNLNIEASSKDEIIKKHFDEIDLFHIWTEQNQYDAWECGSYAQGTLDVEIDFSRKLFRGSFYYIDQLDQQGRFVGNGNFNISPT